MRKLLLILSLITVLLLPGCTKDDEHLGSNKKKESITVSNGESENKESNKEANKETGDTSNNEDDRENDKLDVLFPAIIIDGVTITVGDDFLECFNDEGNIDEVGIIPGPERIGENKCYALGDTYIFTVNDNGRELVYLIQIGSGQVLVSGVKIGDTVDVLFDTYGDNFTTQIAHKSGETTLSNDGEVLDNTVSDDSAESDDTVSDNNTDVDNSTKTAENVSTSELVYYEYEKNDIIVCFETEDGIITYAEIYGK